MVVSMLPPCECCKLMLKLEGECDVEHEKAAKEGIIKGNKWFQIKPYITFL